MPNQNNLLKTIFNSPNIGLIVLNEKYIITQINSFIIINTSFKESDLIGKHINSLITTHDKLDSFTNIVNNRLDNDRSIHITHQIKKSDSNYFWADISGDFYDKYSVWTISNVENKNFKEKAIKEILTSIYKKDNTSFMDSITSQLAETLNADHTFIGEIQDDKLSVKTLSHCMDKKVVDGFEYNLENTPCELVNDGKVSVFPQDVRSLFPHDQDLKDLNIEGYAGIPLFNEKNETLGLIVALYRKPIKNPEFVSSTIGLFANIIANEYERQKAERLVNEQAMYYQSVLDGINEPLMVIDKNYNVVLMNKAANQHKSLKCIEDTDHPKCYEVSHKQSHPCDGLEHPCPLKEVIEKKETVVLTHIHPDENNIPHYVELTANPLFDKNNEFIGIIESTKDITESLHSKKIIEEKNKILLEQSKMVSMGEMLEAIAHQWRQPLSVITTSASAMKMQKEYKSLSEELLNSLTDSILDSAIHLSDTIDDFRNFYKSDKKAESYNLKETIQKTLNLLRSKLKNRDIEILINCKDIEILGFEKEMIQLFMNIINNAKDILEETNIDHKLIKIDVYKDNEDVIILFQDNGGGIPEEIIGKVFEAKFTTKSDKDGTGIGLYMSKLIAQKANGNLEVKNKEFEFNDKSYKGACFIISIPFTN